MLLRLTVPDAASPGGERVLVLTCPDAHTPAWRDVVRAARESGLRLPTDLHAADGTRIDAGSRLGRAPLLDGAALGPGAFPSGRPRPTPGVRVVVVDGPDAGGGVTMSRERPVVIGRDPGGDPTRSLTVSDADTSRRHCAVEVTPGGVVLTDLGSTNGTHLGDPTPDPATGPGPDDPDAAGTEEGDPVGGGGTGQVTEVQRPRAAPWPPGERVQVGSSWLRLLPPPAWRSIATAPASVDSTVGADGTVPVHRGPRDAPRLSVREHRGPSLAPPPRRQPMPVIAWMLPLVVSVVLAAVLRMPMLALFGLLSPAMILGSFLTDRRRDRRYRREDAAEYAAALVDLRRRVEADLAHERRVRESWTPDLGAVGAQVGPPGLGAVGRRLWERRMVADSADTTPSPGTSDAAGAVRLGLGPVESLVRVRAPDAHASDPTPRVLPAAPVAATVLPSGLTVAGPADPVRRLASSVLLQLAVWHRPADVRVLLLVPDPPAVRTSEAFAFVGWLPHAVRATPGHLLALVGQRRAALEAAASAGGRTDRSLVLPRVLVVVDALTCAATGLSPADVERWGEEADRLGVVPLWLTPDAALSPPGDRPRVVLGDVCGRLHGDLHADGRRSPFRPTLPTAGWASDVARALAPLRAADDDAAAGAPPRAVRLLDLLPPGHLADGGTGLAQAWRRRPASTEAVLGSGGVQDPWVAIDLVRDGPHALVGGTTGSGKSELLQTLVASLALANRPDRLVFVLVDYKGGAGFAGCAALPHTVGLVTDLDPYLADRALRSLGAELTRREHLFAAVGATSLPEYERRRRDGDPVVPRLVLAIDEFRILAEEMPDFLGGLVRIAAVGRSLGVHLVLATQRPGGIVSSDIKANVNLRIALRMRDVSDSQDVLDSGQAASLPEDCPGRALLRTGTGPPRLVQSARVTLPRPRAATHGSEDVSLRVHTAADPWGAEPASDATGSGGPSAADESDPGVGDTDLDAVAALTLAAADRLRVQVPASPWLPPLPTLVSRAALPPPTGGVTDPHTVPWGLRDVPDRQAQEAHVLDLRAGCHLGIIGGPRSGRTTAVRTLVASACAALPPALLHVAVHDPGDALGGLDDLPHTWAVAGGADLPLGIRLTRHLRHQIATRRTLLATAGASSVEEYDRARPAAPLGHVLHVVDGWSGLLEQYGEHAHGQMIEDLLGLVRDGAAAGYRLLVTGDRALLTSRIAPLLSQTACLALPDPDDLVMAGVPRASVPAHQPPGRAVLVPSGDHVQVAVLGDAADGASARADLRGVVDRARREHPGPGERLVRLPSAIDRGDAVLTPPDAGGPAGPLVLGLGLTDAVGTGTAAVTLARGGRAGPVVITGPPGSGRSTAALTLLAADPPSALLVSTRPPSPTADASGVMVCSPDDPEAVAAALRAPRTLVAVDDLAEVVGTPTDDLLTDWWAAMTTSADAVLVLCGVASDVEGAFRGVAALGARARRVLVLTPRAAADVLPFGLRHPPVCEALPGRGALLERGRQTLLQVATSPT